MSTHLAARSEVDAEISSCRNVDGLKLFALSDIKKVFLICFHPSYKHKQSAVNSIYTD